MQKTGVFALVLVLALVVLAAFHLSLSAPLASQAVRFLGLAAFLLLCLALAAGPLAFFWPDVFGSLAPLRKGFGLAAFVLVLLHLGAAAGAYFQWDFGKLVSFLPLQIGAAAVFVMLAAIVLAAGAPNGKNGARWQIVKLANILAFALSFVHFAMQSKIISGTRPANPAEYALVALGLAVIILQIAASAARMMKKPEAGAPRVN